MRAAGAPCGAWARERGSCEDAGGGGGDGGGDKRWALQAFNQLGSGWPLSFTS